MLKTEVHYGRRERHVKFLRNHVIEREGHIQTCTHKKPQQITLFIRTYVTKWNISELQSGVYPNRRDVQPLNTTEKDILLVKNILHNKEYDINIMDVINKEKKVKPMLMYHRKSSNHFNGWD